MKRRVLMLAATGWGSELCRGYVSSCHRSVFCAGCLGGGRHAADDDLQPGRGDRRRDHRADARVERARTRARARSGVGSLVGWVTHGCAAFGVSGAGSKMFGRKAIQGVRAWPTQSPFLRSISREDWALRIRVREVFRPALVWSRTPVSEAVSRLGRERLPRRRIFSRPLPRLERSYSDDFPIVRTTGGGVDSVLSSPPATSSSCADSAGVAPHHRPSPQAVSSVGGSRSGVAPRHCRRCGAAPGGTWWQSVQPSGAAAPHADSWRHPVRIWGRLPDSQLADYYGADRRLPASDRAKRKGRGERGATRMAAQEDCGDDRILRPIARGLPALGGWWPLAPQSMHRRLGDSDDSTPPHCRVDDRDIRPHLGAQLEVLHIFRRELKSKWMSRAMLATLMVQVHVQFGFRGRVASRWIVIWYPPPHRQG